MFSTHIEMSGDAIEIEIEDENLLASVTSEAQLSYSSSNEMELVFEIDPNLNEVFLFSDIQPFSILTALANFFWNLSINEEANDKLPELAKQFINAYQISDKKIGKSFEDISNLLDLYVKFNTKKSSYFILFLLGILAQVQPPILLNNDAFLNWINFVRSSPLIDSSHPAKWRNLCFGIASLLNEDLLTSGKYIFHQIFNYPDKELLDIVDSILIYFKKTARIIQQTEYNLLENRVKRISDPKASLQRANMVFLCPSLIKMIEKMVEVNSQDIKKGKSHIVNQKITENMEIYVNIHKLTFQSIKEILEELDKTDKFIFDIFDKNFVVKNIIITLCKQYTEIREEDFQFIIDIFKTRSFNKFWQISPFSFLQNIVQNPQIGISQIYIFMNQFKIKEDCKPLIQKHISFILSNTAEDHYFSALSKQLLPISSSEFETEYLSMFLQKLKHMYKDELYFLNFVKQVTISNERIVNNIIEWICKNILEPKLSNREFKVLEQLNCMKVDNAACRKLYDEACQIFNSNNIIQDDYDSFLTNDFSAIEIVAQCTKKGNIFETINYVLAFEDQIKKKTLNFKIANALSSASHGTIKRLIGIIERCYISKNFEIPQNIVENISAIKDDCGNINEIELILHNFLVFNNILDKEKKHYMRELLSTIFKKDKSTLPLIDVLAQYEQSPLKQFEKAIRVWNKYRRFASFEKIIEKVKKNIVDRSLDEIGKIIFQAKDNFVKKICKILDLLPDKNVKIKSIQFLFPKSDPKEVEEIRSIFIKELCESYGDKKWDFLILMLQTIKEQDEVLLQIKVILFTKKYINLRNNDFYEEIERYYNLVKDPEAFSKQEFQILNREYIYTVNLIKTNFMNSYLNVYSLLSVLFQNSELINFILDKLSDSIISHAEGYLTSVEKPGITLQKIEIIQQLYTFLKKIQEIQTQKEVLKETEQFNIQNKDNLNLCFKESASLLEMLRNFIGNEIEPIKINFVSIKQILQSSEVYFEQVSPNKWEYTCVFKTIAGEERQNRGELAKLSKMAFLCINLSQKSKEKIDEDNLKKCLQYYDYINLLNKIHIVLNDLSNMSYPIPEKKFKVECISETFPKALELLDELKNKLNKWEDIIRNSYEKNKSLTYFTPYQLEILEGFFFHNTNSEEALSLLEYAGVSFPSTALLTLSSGDINGPSEVFRDEFELKIRRLNMVSEKLDELLAERLCYNIGNSQLQIYSINGHKFNNEKKAKLNDILFNKTTLKIDITKYLYLINNQIPQYRQLLFCNEETLWQEVLSFIYRCLNNRTEEYTLIFPERLSYENQKRMKEELLLPLNKEKIVFMPLNIIFLNNKSLIIQFFLEKVDCIKDLMGLDDEDHSVIVESVKKFMRSKFEAYQIIESQGPGQGKSTHIKNSSKKVIWVDIAGHISYMSLAQQIKKSIQEAQINKEEKIIAFKIHQVLDLETLEIVMFQLMLYSKLLQGNEIISVPKCCAIELEIQNTINRPIFFKKYFFHCAIGNIYYGSLKFDKKKLALVCNFLYLFKSKNLKSNLSLDLLSRKPLDSEKSLALIMEYFWRIENVEKIDYSLQSTSCTLIQLKIFLNFMERQISFFNNLDIDSDKNTPSLSLVFEMLLATAQNITSSNYMNRLEIEKEIKKCYTFEDDYLKTHGSRYEKLKKSMAFFTPQGQFAYLHNRTDKHKNCTLLKSSALFQHNYACNNLLCDEYHVILSKLFSIKAEASKINYVLTEDNFFKIIYIYMRVYSNIPVVLIGETGCGKTFTIRYMCKHLKLGKLKTINIHSGLSAKNIIDHVLKICNKAVHDISQLYWIFFDELNTNENIGIISAMISDRIVEGNKLPKNIRFLAACNPFRLAKPNEISSIGFAPQENLSQKLEYRVFPLPETLMEYSWNIGEVDENSGKRYIEEVVKKLMKEEKINNKMEEKKILEMLIESHSFFVKNENEKHLVSYRDLQRFGILFKFFYKLAPRENRAINSAILALLFCYHYRIASQARRGNYISILSNSAFAVYSPYKINMIIKNTQEQYLKDIKLPPGIVWTESLREIMFVMIVCIQNRIPLLVVGKPGCSKSLAIKIIAQNFQGINSKSDFLKQFHKFVLFTFQGTNNTTPEEVNDIFERARLGYKNTQNVTTVVLFEEIGQAELSEKNPLKILHSQLDLQRDRNQTVAFVGLSNWSLDTAKMNRALVLSRLPPTESELKEIGIQFAKQFDLSPSNTKYIKYLSQSYWEFYNSIQNCNTSLVINDSDKYGMRDFISLISETCTRIRDIPMDEGKLRLIKCLIYKNFGIVHLSSFPSLWDKFYSHKKTKEITYHFPEFSELEVTQKSLKQSEMQIRQRYILFVGNSGTLQFTNEYFLHIETSKMKVIVGSQFPNDQNNPEYTEKILSTIIFCMDNGIPVILVNMMNLYTYLYDLFNQLCGQNYCRIALSSGYHPLVRIDPKFMCMVFMDEVQFSIENPPLLNRFEKHIIKLGKHFTEEEKEVYTKLKSWTESIVKQGNNDNLISDMKLQNLFMNYSKTLLKIIVKQEVNEKDTKEGLFQSCRERIIQLGTMELAIVNSIGVPSIERTFIWDIYSKSKIRTLLDEIKDYSLTDAQKKERWLIFTYITELNSIKNSAVFLLNFSTITSEDLLNNEISKFFQSTQTLLLVLVDYTSESKHVLLLANIIQEKQRDSKKNVFILISSRRGRRKKMKSIYLPEYRMKAYDYLEMKIDLIDKLYKGRDDMILQLIMNNLNKNFHQYLQKAVTMVNREIEETDYYFEDESRESENNIFRLIHFLSEEDKVCLIEPFEERIKEAFYKTKMIPRLMKYLSSMESLRFRSFEFTLEKFITDNIESWMKYIVYCIEQYSALSSFFYSCSNKAIRAIWLQNFKNISMEWTEDLEPRRAECRVNSYVSSLRFPFSKIVYDKVSSSGIDEETTIQTASNTINKIFETISDRKKLYIDLMRDTLRIFLVKNKLPKKERYVKLLLKMLLHNEELRTQEDLSRASAFVLICSSKIINLMHIIKVYESMTKANKIEFSRFHLESNESILENFKKSAYEIINSIISDLSPKKDLLQHESPTRYVDKLIQIMYFVPYIDANYISKNSSYYMLLKFWADFAQLLFDQPNPSDILIFISEKLRGLEQNLNNSSFEIIQSSAFLEFIKPYLSNIKKAERYSKFINTFYTILVNKPSHIQEIVQDIEAIRKVEQTGKINNGLPLLGRLVKAIFKEANLEKTCGDFSLENKYIKLLNIAFNKIPFLLTNDVQLPASSNHFCLEMILFYMMYKNGPRTFQITKKIVDKALEELVEEPNNLQPIHKMKNICLVRWILESAAMSKPLTEEIKTSLENHYQGSNPIDTTIRVFMYQLLSPIRRKDFVDKYKARFNPEIIAESIYHDVIFCIPSNEKQFNFMLEVSQLFKHIKLVNFEGDKDIVHYFEPIFLSIIESYDNQIGLVFSAINEFYIIQNVYKKDKINFKYFSESLEKWPQKSIFYEGIFKSTLHHPNFELQEFLRRVMKMFEMDMDVFYINDLPKDNIEYYLRIMSVSIIGVVICGRHIKNPFTNIFFENGELDPKYPEKLHSKFVIGSQNWIQNNSKKGFKPFDINNMEFGTSNEDNLVNSLLSFMLFTMMAYFYKRVESTEKIFPENTSEFLQLVIIKSFDNIISRISVVPKLKNIFDNNVILVQLIIGCIADFMGKTEESEDHTIEYVTSLKEALVSSLCIDCIPKYKKKDVQMMHTLFNKTQSVLCESISDPYIRYQSYFKQIEKPNFKKMMALYKTKSETGLSQQILYPLTDILSFFKESDIKILSLVFPLSQFIQKVYEKYMFKITKKEAESQELVLVSNQKNQEIYLYYNNCRSAIEKILEVKPEKNSAIEAILAIESLFKNEATISEYIIYPSPAKCKIREALVQICKKHNSFIKKFDEIVSKTYKQPPLKKASIFSLTKEEVLTFDKIKSYDSLASEKSWCCYPENNSMQLAYNFEDIDAYLLKELSRRRKISTKTIEYFHFKNENIFELEIIEDVMKWISNRLHQSEEEKKVPSQMLSFNCLEGDSFANDNTNKKISIEIKEELRKNGKEFLYEIFNRLIYLMHHILKTKDNIKPSTNIAEYCYENISMCNPPIFFNYSFDYLLYIFEQLEEEAFSVMEHENRIGFHKTQDEIEKILVEIKKYKNERLVVRATKRLIVRSLLTSQNFEEVKLSTISWNTFVSCSQGSRNEEQVKVLKGIFENTSTTIGEALIIIESITGIPCSVSRSGGDVPDIKEEMEMGEDEEDRCSVSSEESRKSGIVEI